MGNLFRLREVNKSTKECHQRRRRPETPPRERRLSRTCALFATTSSLTTLVPSSRELMDLSQPPRMDSHTPVLSKDLRARSGLMETSTNTSSPQPTTPQVTLWPSPESPMPRTEPTLLLTSRQTHERST